MIVGFIGKGLGLYNCYVYCCCFSEYIGDNRFGGFFCVYGYQLVDVGVVYVQCFFIYGELMVFCIYEIGIIIDSFYMFMGMLCVMYVVSEVEFIFWMKCVNFFWW